MAFIKDLPPEYKRLFNQLRNHLREKNLFDDVADVHLLLKYVKVVETLDRAEVILTDEGLVVEGSSGIVKPHPAVTIQNIANGQLVKLAGALGIGAGARRRIMAGHKSETSAEDDVWKN